MVGKNPLTKLSQAHSARAGATSANSTIGENEKIEKGVARRGLSETQKVTNHFEILFQRSIIKGIVEFML